MSNEKLFKMYTLQNFLEKILYKMWFCALLFVLYSIIHFLLLPKKVTGESIC